MGILRSSCLFLGCLPFFEALKSDINLSGVHWPGHHWQGERQQVQRVWSARPQKQVVNGRPAWVVTPWVPLGTLFLFGMTGFHRNCSMDWCRVPRAANFGRVLISCWPEVDTITQKCHRKLQARSSSSGWIHLDTYALPIRPLLHPRYARLRCVTWAASQLDLLPFARRLEMRGLPAEDLGRHRSYIKNLEAMEKTFHGYLARTQTLRRLET